MMKAPKSINNTEQLATEAPSPETLVSVIECFETDGGVNSRSDRLI
jgi:hypothetical protein